MIGILLPVKSEGVIKAYSDGMSREYAARRAFWKALSGDSEFAHLRFDTFTLAD